RRRVRLGPRPQRLAARGRGQRALPRLARAEPRAPLPRLPPLHGPARPLHAARGAPSAGAARGAPRGRGRAGGPARAAARKRRARRRRGGAPPAALRRRDPRLGRGAGDVPRRPRRARRHRLDDRRADGRPRRGVPGARAPEAPLPPLRRAAPRAARDRGPGRAPRAVAEQAQGIDLFPTRAALLGTAPPRGLPGHALLATRAEPPAISETLYGLMPDGATTLIVSLRTARWKLIHAPALERYE